MTPQEAIYWCEQFTDNIVLADPQKEKMVLALQAMRECKQALEKQIPQKPIKYDDCEQFFVECPCCQKRFDSRLGYKGCPYCLQAIYCVFGGGGSD